MEIVKAIVEELISEGGWTNGLIVMPIYNLKTIDVKRGTYLLVYVLSRDIMIGGVGGFEYFEDAKVVFDFRSDNYEEYSANKRRLKQILKKWASGVEKKHIYSVLMDRELELSNKARGLYRFVVNTTAYRFINPEEWFVWWSERFDDGQFIVSLGGELKRDIGGWSLVYKEGSDNGGVIYSGNIDMKGVVFYGSNLLFGIWENDNGNVVNGYYVNVDSENNSTAVMDTYSSEQTDFNFVAKGIRIENGKLYIVENDFENDMYYGKDIKGCNEIFVLLNDESVLNGYDMYRRWF